MRRGSFNLRMLLISVLAGILSAVAAAVLFIGLEAGAHFCQGKWMGVQHPRPAGENLVFLQSAPGQKRLWVIVALPALGGLLSGLLLRVCPEVEGHGMEEVIRSFHQSRGTVRRRVPFVKALATIVTVGSGGSGGREGPIAQIGAGLGVWLSDSLGLGVRERRIFLLAGAAGAIGAIFRAPLGGALTALGFLYKEDLEASALVPCLTSSITSYALFMAFVGSPLLGIHIPTIFAFPEVTVHPLKGIPYFLCLALICAGSGRLFMALFHGLRTRALPALCRNMALRAMVGGMGVGVLGLVSVKVLGAGRGYLQETINTVVAGRPPDEVLALAGAFFSLAFLRMLATSLTVGSGGSGGVFGPSLLIGSLVGAGTGCLFHVLMPGWHVPPLESFTILGMAGLFAGVANAPLGSVVMVCEMTASYSLLAPLLLVCIINLLINRRVSLYQSQLTTRFDSPAHRSELVTDILANVFVRDCYHRGSGTTVVRGDTPARELRGMISTPGTIFPLTVVDDSGRPTGILSMGRICTTCLDENSADDLTADDVATLLVTCTPGESLSSVSRKVKQFGYSRIPVTDGVGSPEILGYVQYEDILTAYSDELNPSQSNDSV